MSEEKKTSNENLPAFVKAAPELLPVWDWWVKEGKSTVAMLLVAALVVAGFYTGRNWLRGRDAGANQALVNAYAVDELESALVTLSMSADITAQANFIRDEIIPKMSLVRVPADEAETLTAEKYWPFPTYGELLFGV